MGDLLVLWDVDYTLLNAAGLGNRLYEVVFREMFGRELTAVAPKAGRTDRAIITDTLALAGIPEPRAQVDGFLAALGHLAAADGGRRAEVQPWPARPRPSRRSRPPVPPVCSHRQHPAAGGAEARAAGLGQHLDLDAGAYGDAHEVRAELVTAARRAARPAYGADFAGSATILIGDTPLDVEAALATGARVVGVATGSYSAAELAAAGAHAVLPDLTDPALVLAAVTGRFTGRLYRSFLAGGALARWVSDRRAEQSSPDGAAGRAWPGQRPSHGCGAPRPPRRRSRKPAGTCVQPYRSDCWPPAAAALSRALSRHLFSTG